jgi:molybdenum cofactor cytidylyltransferase
MTTARETAVGQVAAVILAAGTSRRLRRPKQTLPLRGRPLLQHVVDAAVGAGLADVVVVLGHASDKVEERIRFPAGVRTVMNEDYRSGQASSLRTGLEALGEEIDAAVVLLGDQPDIPPETIRAVVDAFRDRHVPIVQATYGGSPSHPVLLARETWEEARAIEGDIGARELIAQHPDRVARVEIGGEPPSDLDTWQDYENLRDD